MRRIFAALSLSVIAGSVSAAGPAPSAALVQRELAERQHRFLSLPAEASGGAAFRAMVPGRQIGFDTQGVVMDAREGAGLQSKQGGVGPLRMRFEGAAPVQPQGFDASPAQYHWLVGPSAASWQTHLRTYAGIAYRQVWPGIDAVFTGSAAGLKYQFELAPGADPARVAWVVEGADRAEVLSDGSLVWHVAGQRMADAAPLVFQPGAGGQGQVVVTSAYRLESLGAQRWRVGFRLGAYDASRPLIIDPAWTGYSGLVGGNSDDLVYAVARDSDGNTYACGVTQSTDLPVTTGGGARGATDAFVVKFNASGAVQFVTYVGGSGEDACHGLALDGLGRIYLAGGTTSNNFPAVGTDAANRLRRSKTGDHKDAFVVRLANDGASVGYAGYIGGSEDDQANGIAVDALGRAYVTGYSVCTASAGSGCTTTAPQFPAHVGPRTSHGGDASATGGMDPFLARVAANGSTLEYAGFLGGDGGDEAGHAVAVKSDGSAVVVGATNSSAASLPTLTGFRTITNSDRTADLLDAFVATVPESGGSVTVELLTGSGAGIDRALAVAIAADGSVLVGGETSSSNFPANNAGARALANGPYASNSGGMDGFIVRLGGSLPYATYLGGSGYDSVGGIAQDADAVYVVGQTASGAGFPVQAQSGLTTTPRGLDDGFIVRLTHRTAGSAAQVAYSGFLGTAAYDGMWAVAAGTLGADTILSVGGFTSTSGSNGLTAPTTGALSGGAMRSNGLVLRIDPFGPPAAMTVESGNGQSTQIGAAFAQSLSLKITDQDGRALPGVVVNFSVPGSGASASLAPSTSATTDAAGVATVTATANMVAGSYNVSATSGSLTAQFALTNAQGSQVGFSVTASPGSVVFGGQATLSTSGGSGTGAVSYAVTAGGSFCSVTGSTLSATGAGTCTVTATKASDGNYQAATATVDVTVTKAEQAGLSVAANPASVVLNGTAALSTTGGTGAGAVSYAVTAGATSCSVTGSTLTALAIGNCTVTATKAGDANYNPVTGTVQVTVTRASQSPLTVSAAPAPSVQVNGSATLSTTGGSGTGSVAYAVTAGASFCSVSGAVVTGVLPGTCTVTATKAADADFEAVTATLDITVGKADQAGLTAVASPAAIVYLGTSALSTTGGSGSGAVSYSITAGAGQCQLSGATVTGIGVGNCTVTATKAADALYNAASATVDITVSKAAQPTLTLSANPASLQLQQTASLSVSGGAGTGGVAYSVTQGGTFCSVTGSTVRGDALGTCEITASKAGDAFYLPATATLSLSVGKIVQTITFAALPAKALGDADFTVSATASSNLTVSFASATPAVCSVTGATVRLLGVGTCRLTASQAGDATYAAASAVQQDFAVTVPAGVGTSISGNTPGGQVLATTAAPWQFTAAGNGLYQSAGFIGVSGHPKSPGSALSGWSFPYGVFDFVATGGAVGGSVSITFTYPQALPAGARFWKYGPTASNTTPHWYPFDSAVVAGNTVTITIVDGGLGDDDLVANGIVRDAGGIGVPAPSNAASIPTLGGWALILLSGLLGLWGMRHSRRVGR